MACIWPTAGDTVLADLLQLQVMRPWMTQAMPAAHTGAMHMHKIPASVASQVIALARDGRDPDVLMRPLLDLGWDECAAGDAVERLIREYLAAHARSNALPEPVHVPSPIEANGGATIVLPDRRVGVLASLLLPRVVIFGGLLSDSECAGLIEQAQPRMRRSQTLNLDSGLDEDHAARTSRGAMFRRGETPLCRLIEARIAALLNWPEDRGEGLQILSYGPGAQYEPHHDYFDPNRAGTAATLARGGQRVATVVMYLNTPEKGGATVFPEAHLEVGAVQGNAVFFSYDRPHPITRSLHGGAPVQQGEKWIATKWLRERRHD